MMRRGMGKDDVRLLPLALVLIGAVGSAWANCSGPFGVAGNVNYAANLNMMVFCDGTNWVSMSGGANVSVGGNVNNPGGADTYVQFNSGGTAFGGSSAFTWNSATSTLTATNISATNLSGLLQTAAQPNITSVGTLTGLTMGGNIAASGFTVSATNLYGSSVSATAGNIGSLSATTATLNSLGAGNVNVSGYVSANNLSAALIQVGPGNGVACDSNHKGSMRYSTPSSTMEYCNGNSWYSMGPSATQPVSFLVNRGGSSLPLPVNNATKISWTNKVYDTNNNFNNDRFTPTVSGKYIFILNAYCNGATVCYAGIYKNGVKAAESGGGTFASGEQVYPNTTTILDMNGSTDYVEAYVYSNASSLPGYADTLYLQDLYSVPRVEVPSVDPPRPGVREMCSTIRAGR